MTAKKMKVISGIGLLTVLINVVSSELLYTAQILNHIPDYDELTGKNGEGEYLDYELLNDGSRLTLGYIAEAKGNTLQIEEKYVYFVESSLQSGFRLNLISAELVKSLSQRRASLEVIQEEPNSCGITPAIKASPRKRQCSNSCLNCITSNEESTSRATSQEYCFTELSIKIKNRPSSPSLMKLSLKFYNKEKKKFIGVYMMMFETPKTEEDIQLKEKHNVFVLSTIPFIHQLSAVNPDIREVMSHVINLKDTIPWLTDVLDRAKYIKSVKPKSMSCAYTDWYYAGAVETNPQIFYQILNLEYRWKHYIREDY